MSKAPDLFWGTIVSMYIGNGMLLVLNLPLIPLWVQVLKVPYYLLYPLILLFCLIGSYSIENNVGDVMIMLVFGIVGYLMKKFRYDGAPLVLALVLGRMLETTLRQSLILSRGDFSIFVSRPISLGFLDCRGDFIDYPHPHSAKEALNLRGRLKTTMKDRRRTVVMKKKELSQPIYGTKVEGYGYPGSHAGRRDWPSTFTVPDAKGRFPALLGIAPHNKFLQRPEVSDACPNQPAWAPLWCGPAEGGTRRS